MTATTNLPKPYRLLGFALDGIATDEAAGLLTAEQARREREWAEADAYNEMREW